MVATRTVRLDDEAEAVLQQIRYATGLPISEALKQGLQSLRQRVGEESRRSPCDIYQQLDLGPGGYAIITTAAVLTEAFHVLGPSSIGSDRLREFIEKGGLSVWCFDRPTLTRAFELMELYADHPMDLADASLVTAAEALDSRRVFTIDRNDFDTYRVRRGHRHHAIQIVS